MRNNKLCNFKNFQLIMEKVYLFKTIFTNYELIVDTFSEVGVFNLKLKEGSEVKLEVQIYGKEEDKEIIIKTANKMEMELFKTIINDIVYILNKNKFKYKFTIKEISKERRINNPYAILSFNKEMTINDLERIAQTTKIINPKVKKSGEDDIDDFDDRIYKTL